MFNNNNNADDNDNNNNQLSQPALHLPAYQSFLFLNGTVWLKLYEMG